jgi:hypothetical protein
MIKRLGSSQTLLFLQTFQIQREFTGEEGPSTLTEAGFDASFGHGFASKPRPFGDVDVVRDGRVSRVD